LIDWFYTFVSIIIGVVIGASGLYLKYKDYIIKTANDLAEALKDGKIDFREVLFLMLDAYAWKTNKRFVDVCNEVKAWIDAWIKE
jgi:uncharacterized membrane-anchored protein YhcB (DUF1043 family)